MDITIEFAPGFFENLSNFHMVEEKPKPEYKLFNPLQHFVAPKLAVDEL